MENNKEETTDLDCMGCKGMPYVVPVGYFGNLTNQMLEKALSPSASLQKNHFSLLDSTYFETFPQALLQKIHASGEEDCNELSQIAPVLSGISKEGKTFIVPVGYFERFHVPIVMAKVIPLYPQSRNKFKWLQLAAALFAVVFFTAASAFFLHQKKEQKIYAYYHNMNISSEMAGVTDSDIINYLGETSEEGMVNSYSHPVSLKMDYSLRNTLQQASMEELEGYLKNGAFYD